MFQSGDIDITQIAELVGSLIGGSGGLGDIDIGQIANLVGGLISGNAASDLDIGAIVGLISFNFIHRANQHGHCAHYDTSFEYIALMAIQPDDFDIRGILPTLTQSFPAPTAFPE